MSGSGKQKVVSKLLMVRPDRIADYLFVISGAASLLVFFFMPSVPENSSAPLWDFAGDDYMFIYYLFSRVRPFVYLLFAASLGFKINSLLQKKYSNLPTKNSKRRSFIAVGTTISVLGIIALFLYQRPIIYRFVSNMSAAADATKFKAWQSQQSPLNVMLLRQSCPTAELKTMGETQRRDILMKIGDALSWTKDRTTTALEEITRNAPGPRGESLRRSLPFQTGYVKDHIVKCMKELGPAAWVIMEQLTSAYKDSKNSYRRLSGASFAPFDTKGLLELAKILSKDSGPRPEVVRFATEMLQASGPGIFPDLIKILPQVQLDVAVVFLGVLSGGSNARFVDVKALIAAGEKSSAELQFKILEVLATPVLLKSVPVDFWLDILKDQGIFRSNNLPSKNVQAEIIYGFAFSGINSHIMQLDMKKVLAIITAWIKNRSQIQQGILPIMSKPYFEQFLTICIQIPALNETVLEFIVDQAAASANWSLGSLRGSWKPQLNKFRSSSFQSRLSPKLVVLLRREKDATQIMRQRFRNFKVWEQAKLLTLLGSSTSGLQADLDFLVKYYKGKSKVLSDAAFRGLVSMSKSHQSALDVLLDSLHTKSQLVQTQIAGLAQVRQVGQGAMTELTRAFELSKPDFAARAHSGYALSRAIAVVGEQKGTKFLEGKLKSSNPYHRAAAAEALKKNSPAVTAAHSVEKIPWVRVSMQLQ